MLRLHKLAKFFGERALFRDLTLNIGDGARIGIVGPNGSGKSTLLKLMAGEVEADEGNVQRIGAVTVCYVPQADPPDVAGMAKSGGEKQREKLRRAFDELERAQGRRLLLLDEPTNNLDAESVEELLGRLGGADREVRPYAVVLVSHDRGFLDAIAERILEIDPISAKCTEFGGNYGTYEKLREDAIERTLRMYSAQQRKAAQLKKDIQETKQQATRVENSTVHDYWRGRAKKVAAKAKARETRLTKMMNEENQIEKPREMPKIRIEFAESRLRGKTLIECRDLQLDAPPLRIEALQVFGGEHVVVTGRNGSGKTTLISLLIDDEKVWRLSKAKFATLTQDDLDMPRAQRVLDWFEHNCDRSFTSKADTRTFLHRFLFSGDQVFQPISTLSSGERVRLRLAAIMAGEPDVIVLDEPTNHLDIDSIKRIEEALLDFKGTLIVVTHDKAFREFLKPDQHWHLEDGRVSIVS